MGDWTGLVVELFVTRCEHNVLLRQPRYTLGHVLPLGHLQQHMSWFELVKKASSMAVVKMKVAMAMAKK